MKISILLLFLCLFSITAENIYPQQKELSLNLKNVTLGQAISEIEQTSDYVFLITDDARKELNKKTDIHARRESINKILESLLKNTSLKYSVIERQISVYKSDSKTKIQQVPTSAREITGRVMDGKGELLIGVNVIEVGTTNGTITDNNGTYTIRTTTDRPKLKFSYIGFKDQEVSIGKENILDVVIEEAVGELDEIVVVGYGEQRKISTIGSQSSLKIQDVKAPTGSLSNVLAGRLAGIVGVQRTGEPGKDAADIWIRGISTPNGSTPLILVDGVERPFNDLDPEDIESITLLKDASATAVYGVRGANGVLVIKTKPGIIGKPSVNIDYYEGFNRFTKDPIMANGITYMEAANEASYNMGEGQYKNYSQEYIENTRSGSDPLLYPNVNWRKEIFNDWAHSRRANVNIRGGSQMAQFYSSVSYYNETGMIKTNDSENYDSGINFNRYNFMTNLNVQLTPTTKVDVGVQGYLSNGNYPAQSSQTIFSSTMEVNPVKYPAMFVVDGVQYVPGTHTQGAERNPYSDATKRGYRKTMSNRVQSNVRITQDLDFLLKGLSLTSMFAFDAVTTRERWYEKRENTYYFKDRSNPYDEQGKPILIPTWNSGSTALSFGKSFEGQQKDYFEASLNWERLFGEDHRVSAMAIYTQESRTYNEANNIIQSIPFRVQGFAGRATYALKDRYFAEFNIGYNGGENFPKTKRFGTFPAIGAGWVPSSEPFWDPIKDVFSFFKIRYTYGKVGNSRTGTNLGDRRFMYIEQYGWNNDYGYSFGTNGRSGVVISNPRTDLGWEVATKQDLGFDLKFFKDDLNVTFDLFKENRTDILLLRNNSLPGYAGFQSVPYGNVGETKTLGFDGNIEYFKRINNDWAITLRGNMTYADPEWVDDDQPLREYAWRNRKGFSLTSIEGYEALGLYTQTDIDLINAWYALPASERANTPQPFPTPPKVGLTDVKAGDMMYKDMNEDGKIDDNDKSWLGNGDVPILNYGFGFNLDYKRFSLGVLFQGTGKANRFIGGIVRPFNDAGVGAVYSNITDRWSQDNPKQDAFYPRLAYGNDALGNQNNFENSTWWLKDMSFFRLKTLQLSYKLPKTWCEKANVNNASVYMMGMNLFTFSKWKLWDPELNTDNGTKYPNTTSFTVGVTFSF
ncbi:MAG TPA: SusC/RagA family protein [Porphyromonadaceae bacterium]|nr:SusC/RagA family protein [Porphyromonadaceae bacterium]HBX46763.1 SusC/RagA family protein [Porphyromonadaceae bacterium]